MNKINVTIESDIPNGFGPTRKKTVGEVQYYGYSPKAYPESGGEWFVVRIDNDGASKFFRTTGTGTWDDVESLTYS